MKNPLKFLLLALVIVLLAGSGFFQIVYEVFAQEVRFDIIPPTEIPGYAQGLQSGGGDLTTLVVMITNYVLGFLGLVAITAIIYAGIMYVANFGNEEMTSKSKTIITYVALGILVILLSYAIVNALVGVVGGGEGGGAGGGSPGSISPSDSPVETFESLFDPTGKDFIYPLLTGLREVGDLCPSTPIGLSVNNSGCSAIEVIPDTDSDGIANPLDTDDDNDGVVDQDDTDDDGDGVSDVSDLCSNTLSFVSFKVLNVERLKIQIDRTDKAAYDQYILAQQGCAEYERSSDIDGDGIPDSEDCDRDSDGLIDTQECSQAFFAAYPPGNPNNISVTPQTRFRGIVVLDVFREDLDTDDDNDGVVDFGLGLQPDARDLLMRQISNNFHELENFIRITCATLPQTRDVLDYCGYDASGNPFGKLVRLLDKMSSDLSFSDFETFNDVYQEFLSIVQSFKRVSPSIQASPFEGPLPSDGSAFRVNFDASDTQDPYEEFCPVSNDNYLWFVNKNLDFSQGIGGILSSPSSVPDGTGVFFNYDFTTSGIFNVQLLVRSACTFNTVNPGVAEANDVDAAISGLSSARISVYPSRASLVVKVNGEDDQGSQPVRILAGTQAPVTFDLRDSQTSQGNFEFLNYDCGNGVNAVLQGNQSNWQFQCQYTDPTGVKFVRLQARDSQGDVLRTVNLQFGDVIAQLQIEPGLTGTTSTGFTFTALSSQSASPIANYTFRILQKVGTTSQEITSFQQQTVSYQFSAPGDYEVMLEVSTGGAANQFDKTSKTISIREQAPIASFRASFLETIRPARVLLDASQSFHPDFPLNNSVLSYSWEVDGVVLQQRTAGATGPFTYERVDAGTDARIFYEFQSLGEHQVRLTVFTGSQSDTVFDTVKVTTLLGVDFTIDKPGAHVNELVTFTPQSDKALGFFWDFGDGDTQVAVKEPVVHKYARQGKYQVSLEVEDGSNNINSLTKQVRVGLQNAPIALTQVYVNGIEQDLEQSACIEVTRKDSVLFDAGKSVSIRGESSGISYLWQIEDFDEIYRSRSFTRIFNELTEGGCIDVDLTVQDLSTSQEDQAETISIEVVNMPPLLTDVRYSAPQQLIVTPVTVSVSALGVRDPDGRVVRYRWWYYEEGQGGRELDARVTDAPRTTFVIGPRGVEGTQTNYSFAVEIEDNDGARVSSFTAEGDSEPLVVTNGPNVAPVAEFVVDKGTVKVNELVTFSSTTKDPLGEFIPSAAYQWDVQGDGEYERDLSGARVNYRYPQPGVYRPTLKVTKNGLSSQYDMTLHVRADSVPPEAAFIFIQDGVQVRFISNSTVDPALPDKNLSYAWDFDTTIDTNGNGINDDDADSALITPIHEFEGNRDVLVGLRVRDSVGVSDQVVRRIPFLKQEERGPLGTKLDVKLKAVLKTNPPRDDIDGRLYLTPPSSDVVFNSLTSTGQIQEYRLDTNIFVDSDSDEITDNDIDNKTHKSWKDGSSFKATYRDTQGQIRAKLTVVAINGQEKSAVVDITFDEKPDFNLNQVDNPDAVLSLLETVPVVTFTVSSSFAEPQQEILFDARGTHFPDEAVQEYRWDFDGDGLVDEISFEPTFSHAYPQVGAYEVVLEAVSARGLIGEYTQTVFIRGGLTLPVADFEYVLSENEVVFTNTSTIDASLNPELTAYEWSFRRLNVGDILEWEQWEQRDDLTIGVREFNQPSVWVKHSLDLAAADVAQGVMPREAVLGSQNLVLRVTEGTTFLDEQAQPFVGTLVFELSDQTFIVEGEDTALVYDTGLSQSLELSQDAEILFNGVIFSPKLYQVGSSGVPVFVSEGRVEDNITHFVISSFGGRYLVTGSVEAAEGRDGELLGISTLPEPVKVLDIAGLYQVTLTIMDELGEIDQKQQLIVIDQDLTIRQPGDGVAEEEIVPVPGEDITPVIPVSEIIPDAGGLSIFWIIFVIVIVLGVAGVVFVVVRTIRQRREELEIPQTPVGSSETPSFVEPVEPEVVEVVPQKKSSTGSDSYEVDREEVDSQELSDKKDNPPTIDSGLSTENEDKDARKGPPSGTSGSIPDWLKG